MTDVAPVRFVEPDKVLTHFHIREGETVADFGAGSGYFTPTLCEAVGSEGKVYACDIQKPLLEKIGVSAEKHNWTQVQVLWCDIDEPGGIKINDDEVEVGILINTLFQLEDKAAAMTEVLRTLHSGAKFYIIDWSESFNGLGPRVGDVVSKSEALVLAETAGFVFERDFPAGDHHYGLAFRKP